MQQTTALAILQSGRNVFLTGQAGAGKTHVLRQYMAWLRARKVAVAVTASTGIAATHMGGQTIHAWSGMGIRDDLDDADLKKLEQRSKTAKALQAAQVLVIDEISMLHARQFALVDKILRHFKKPDAPFGGVQLVVCGDFFQLPPIGTGSQTSRDKFAFMAQAWLDAQFAVCYLHEQHRQQGDALTGILGELRAGSISPHSMGQLQASSKHTLAQPLTQLYTHNRDVDSINQQQLARLPGPAHTFAAQTSGNRTLLQSLQTSVRAPAELQLRPGARVMFVRNKPDLGYFNGTLAEVDQFVDDAQHGSLPQVRLRDGTRRTVAPEEWSIANEHGEILASYVQIPLALAWAITVHKSQGMTLDAAEIDLRHCFEPGQGYVALSRLRTLAGLKVLGLNDMALQLDALAVKADRRFQALSAEMQATHMDLPEAMRQQQSDGFVLRCGGTLDAQEIAAQQAALQHPVRVARAPKPAKGSSVQASRALFEQGMDVAQIAAERNIQTGTVLEHLLQAAKQDPPLDLQRLRPAAATLQDINAARQTVQKRQSPDDLRPDGSYKLAPIFAELQQTHGERYSYDDLRLALWFLD